MNRDEAYAAMDYWGDEIQRSQYYIYECENNIRQIKEQIQQQTDEGWDG